MPIHLKIILTVGFFVLGALLGSLIDLIIFRISRKEPIFKGKFHCDFCGRSLTFAECLPLIGRFAGKGKCRECGKKIPLNYFIMETCCSVLYALTFLVIGLKLELIFALILIPVLVILSLTDITVGEIPYSCSIIIAVLGVISVFTDSMPWYEHLLGMVAIGVPFAILAFLGVMGGGDMQLMAAAGLLLGWRIVPAAAIGIILGAIGGLITKQVTKSNEVRFGPYLAAGVLIGFLFGSDIIDFYIGLIR